MARKIHFLLISVSATFFLICSIFFTFAQTNTNPLAEGLTISPPVFELTLNPGETSKHTIRVTNPTKNLIELYPSSMDFGAAGEGGQPTFLPSGEETGRFSMANWITFETSKIALLPDQVVEFNFQINVPQDPEPGGHYGVVFLATEPPKPDNQNSQVSLSSKVGSLLLVRIPGDINEKGSIEEFSTPWFYFAPPVNFTAYMRNSGNIHFRPDGEITIRDWRGKDLERISFNPARGNVLPDSRRKFEMKWAAANQPFWKIPIGRFSANLRTIYGQAEQTIDNKIYFWIIPWWLIITTVILILLIIVYLIIIIIRRRKKKKKLSQENNFDRPRSNDACLETPLNKLPLPSSEFDFAKPKKDASEIIENISFSPGFSSPSPQTPLLPQTPLPKPKKESKKNIMRF